MYSVPSATLYNSLCSRSILLDRQPLL